MELYQSSVASHFTNRCDHRFAIGAVLLALSMAALVVMNTQRRQRDLTSNFHVNDVASTTTDEDSIAFAAPSQIPIFGVMCANSLLTDDDNKLQFWEERKTSQWVNLSQTKLTDAGLLHLAGLTNIEWLNLSETGITDAGLQEPYGLTNLKRLDLSSTRTTPADRALIQKGVAKLQDHCVAMNDSGLNRS